jgi:RNA polymerase sigma factor (sigma-70 family)
MDQLELTKQQSANARPGEGEFRAIVEQYIGLVYSACVRQLGDRHDAEDATQAVFLLLSQKRGVLAKPYLSGWLLTTARYACANIRRSEHRRVRREQVAAMNKGNETQTEADDIAGLLDEGLCHLKPADREAVAQHYLSEKPVDEVAQKLGVSTEAARKRIIRGLEKLRQYFSRKGIDINSAALGPMLIEQAGRISLPAGTHEALMRSVLTVCQAGPKGVTAGAAIAKGTQMMMLIARLKISAAVVMILTALGASGWMISRTLAENSSPAVQSGDVVETPAAAAATTLLPAIDLSTPEKAYGAVVAALKAGDRAALYRCLAVDANRQPLPIDGALDWNLAENRMMAAARQAYGTQVSQVNQLLTIDAVMDMMAATGPAKKNVTVDTAEFSTQVPPAILAMLPEVARHVASEWSGAAIRFVKQGEDWKFDIDRSMRVEVSSSDPAPADPTSRNVRLLELMGQNLDSVAKRIGEGGLATPAGANRAMNLGQRQLELRNGIRNGMDVSILPVTSPPVAKEDKGWEFISDTPEEYVAAMDAQVEHDGHPTMRISSDSAERTSTGKYAREDTSIGQYLGHRIRVTAWIKAQGVSSDGGIRIKVNDADGNVIADDGQRLHRPVRGTMDWKVYTAFANIPAAAVKIQWGVMLNGRGSVWVDVDSAKLEIADDAAR